MSTELTSKNSYYPEFLMRGKAFQRTRKMEDRRQAGENPPGGWLPSEPQAVHHVMPSFTRMTTKSPQNKLRVTAAASKQVP